MKYSNLTLGQIEACINKLGGEEGLLRLLANKVVVVIREHIVPAGDPLVPEGWTVKCHRDDYAGNDYYPRNLTRTGDDLFFRGRKIELFLCQGQGSGKTSWDRMDYCSVERQLADKDTLPANVLDYLLANPDVIPDSWRVDEKGQGRSICFWGTQYSAEDGLSCVRTLYWDGSKWTRGRTGFTLDSKFPAAVLAS